MEIKIKPVEILPTIKYYMDELGLAKIFDKYVPNRTEMEIAPSQVLSIMIMNIMVSPKPMYRIEDWLHKYMDGIAEMPNESDESAKYNDDRIGRNLDLLFEADRGSFMAEISASAINVHQLETDIIHNDATSVTLIGAYDEEDPKAVKIKHGHNKDHRPDCKQIVFGMNTTEDGHVPISYQVYDGNQAEIKTHIPNWQLLRDSLDKEDFIYVADSKLCSHENLVSIAENGGNFITVVPRNFHEVKNFLDGVREGKDIEWQFELKRPDSRKIDRTQRYLIHEGERMDEGYRILWIHSEAKERQERNARGNRIVKAEEALKELQPRLNQRLLKTREQILQGIQKATHGAKAY